uniref:glutathione transferase n=1 Tax=Pagurus bernhardus TaxID=174397 RepID=W6MEW7_PAGBR
MAYVLHYMDLRARGEPGRWVLKALRQEYTEDRINILTQWAGKKKDFEFEVCPVLMVDGQQLHQTLVICRYLGEKHNLASSDLWTATRQQELMESLHDVSNYVATAFISRLRGNLETAAANVKQVKVRIPVVLRNLEARISNQGWIHSDQMTWVDVAMAACLDIYQDMMGKDLLVDYPRSQALLASIKALPPVADWVTERPPFSKFEDPEGLF